MLKIVAFIAVTIYQASSSDVEILPSAQVAPVAPVAPIEPLAPAFVTSRSSQYFVQNHNALAAPLVAPVPPVAKYVAPVPPVAKYVAPVAPVAQYYTPVASSASAFSQVTRYATAASPLVSAVAQAQILAPAQYVIQPLVGPAPASFAVASAQPVPVVPAQSFVPSAPQQPANTPVVPGPNPDSESVEIESAKLRNLGQTSRNQPLARSQQNGPLQAFAQQQNFASAQQQQQAFNLQLQGSQQNADNSRFSAVPLPRSESQQPSNNQELSARQPSQSQQQPQQQQFRVNNGGLTAAPGFLSAQPFLQGAFLG